MYYHRKGLFTQPLRGQEISAPGGEWATELDMSGLPAGGYVVEARSEEGSASRKVVKE